MQLLVMLYEIVALLTNVLVMLIIIQFIIGLLFAFNVIDGRNEFFGAFYGAINRFMDPVLRPIRNMLPNLGGVDISPVILLLGLFFLRSLLWEYVWPALIR